MLAHLHGGGGDAGDGLVVVLHGPGDIADGEGLGVAGYGEVGVDDDATAAGELDAEGLGDGVGVDAAAPEDVAGFDAFA
ncbi:MAG: hypothetical protein AAF750_14445 [Planctomycetota bacterium]